MFTSSCLLCYVRDGFTSIRGNAYMRTSGKVRQMEKEDTIQPKEMSSLGISEMVGGMENQYRSKVE